MFRVSLLLCILSFSASVYLVYNYVDRQRDTTRSTEEMIREQARRAATAIGNQNSVMRLAVEQLADELSTGILRNEDLEPRLKEFYSQYKNIVFEVGVAFNPQSPCTPGTLHAPHYGNKNGAPAYFALEDYYDRPYTDWPWYRQTISKGASWIEPYLGGATEELVAGFATPFYCPGNEDGHREPAGVTRANLALTDLRERLLQLQLGRTGYGFILSGAGTFIARPVAAYLYDLENIYERDDVKKSPNLHEFLGRGLAGEEGMIEYTDADSEQQSWLALTPVPGTNWLLGAVFFKNEVENSVSDLRRLLIWITTSLIVFFASFLFLLSRAYTGNTRALWLGGSTATAFLLATGVVVVCFLAIRMPNDLDYLETRVTGEAATNNFLRSNFAKQQREIAKAEAPIYVPTGVMIQSVEFSTANNVMVTGYIWQKYDSMIASDISRGFILPEAESFEMVEAYDRPSRNGRVTGWYFRAMLRQSFDYTAYPLDRQNIWLRIWHKDFDHNVILTPDFDSYDYINPVRLPGLDMTDFVLPGWFVEESYFSFRENSYNTNFGIQNYAGQLNYPELYFNIELVRRFVDPFISHIVPLLAIVIMVFAVLVYGTKRREEAVDLGFDASTVLSLSAAFFFTIVIAHVTLRSSLSAQAVVYLEWYYLLMYVVILSVSINALLFSSTPMSANLGRFINFRENLIPKLLYWPVIMGLLFAITVYAFY